MTQEVQIVWFTSLKQLIILSLQKVFMLNLPVVVFKLLDLPLSEPIAAVSPSQRMQFVSAICSKSSMNFITASIYFLRQSPSLHT